MDQFSHDLTLALEETSLMDRACGVGRWGSRRRTRSTGNLRKYLPLSAHCENHLHMSLHLLQLVHRNRLKIHRVVQQTH